MNMTSNRSPLAPGVLLDRSRRYDRGFRRRRSSHQPNTSLLRGIITVAITLGLVAGGASAPASAHSRHRAPDESPGINDTATLKSGKVTKAGNIRVKLNLTCPKGDSFTASMSTLTVGSGAPDDIFSTNRGNETTGTCKGKRQTIKLLLITQPIDGVLFPAPRNCSAEYEVIIDGPAQADGSPRWTIRFDRGGADGGPDGPGPQLCLK